MPVFSTLQKGRNGRFQRIIREDPEPIRAYQPSAGQAARSYVNSLLTPHLGAGAAERIGGAVNKLMAFGPIPAQVATDVAMQPVRAGEAVGEALHDPSAGTVGNALLQAAMAFPTATSSVLRGAGGLVNRVAASPTGRAAVGGAAAAMGLAGGSEAAGDRATESTVQRIVASDPTLQALQRQIDEQNAIANANPKQHTLKNRQMAGERAAELRRQFNARLQDLSKGSLPFSRAHPDIAAWWPAVQWGGPVAASYITKGGGNIADRIATAPWRRAVAKAEDAMLAKSKPAFEYHATKAAKHLDNEPGLVQRLAQGTADEIIPVVAGGSVGMEAAMFPYQCNKSNAPVESAEYDEARRRLSPEEFADTAATGLGPGILGGFTGSHLPNVTPGYKPVAESQALQKMLRTRRKK